MNIEEIYKTISEYNITQGNVLDFLFQGKPNDPSHFYYRTMLLQLMKNNEHLDKMFELYCRPEEESNLDESQIEDEKWLVSQVNNLRRDIHDLYNEDNQRRRI